MNLRLTYSKGIMSVLKGFQNGWFLIELKKN